VLEKILADAGVTLRNTKTTRNSKSWSANDKKIEIEDDKPPPRIAIARAYGAL
jgi:hypothetical protein